MHSKTLLHAFLAFSLFGLVISGYSLLHNRGLTTGEFCTLTETVNCDVVNKGAYSSFVGIPVSLIGVIGYFFLLVGGVLQLRDRDDRSLTQFLLIATSLGLLFSLYLTGLEAFVLHAWCLLCLSSQAIMLVLFGIALQLFLQRRNV